MCVWQYMDVLQVSAVCLIFSHHYLYLKGSVVKNSTLLMFKETFKNDSWKTESHPGVYNLSKFYWYWIFFYVS